MLSDIRVLETKVRFSEEKARVPLKFGKVVAEKVTYAEVEVLVENKAGKTAKGYGGIFLSDFWAFPTFAISHEEKDRAMREFTLMYAERLGRVKEFKHPVELYLEIEPEIKRMCREITKESHFPEDFTLLAGLVCASPSDAGIHDAFGNVNGICSYDGYGKEFMKDLGSFLGNQFQGKYISDYLRKEYLKEIPVFHLVGGLDKLWEREVTPEDPRDGLPVSLEKWLEVENLFCLKVKLRGNDLDWDVARTIEVSKVAHSVYQRLNLKKDLFLSVDTNEVCERPEYIVEMLNRIRERDRRTFEEILYVEQPTGRDLSQYEFDMEGIAGMKPVLVDESLTGIPEFYRAKDLKWSGLALKTCKCHSAELLMVALSAHHRMPYTIQDLTNPRISLVHSAGFAGRTYPMMGVESNASQFFPSASRIESRVHPGIFSRKGGYLNLSTLGRMGLGYRIEEII
ncbi:MAG: hypothetical protein V2A65_09745 [Candidatus Omnitrophota bacterium]